MGQPGDTVELTSSLFGLLRPAECGHRKITGVGLKEGEISLGRENGQQLCPAGKMGLQQKDTAAAGKTMCGTWETRASRLHKRE